MKLTVLGPGCWGLTLAKLLTQNFDRVCVWGREQDISDELRNEKKTTKPVTVELDPKTEISSDLKEAISDADYILKLIAMVFTSPQSSALVTDVGMWRLCLLSETGQNFKYEGALTSQSENDPLGIASEELRIILSMPELAAFDGKVSEG